ncbi:myb/SANT-like DNA-binding domain-containing protein 3 [Periplaneta americana]|uniref:myb/SANT-like DNA-binding domain-containing protein 3 n=1 Tax=Periplaneta americana TaxID=6978 RepID=UPI0037E91AC2
MAAEHKLYTAEEKLLLIDLVGKHKILEDKRTDIISLSKKKKTWEDVCNAYNEEANVTKRTVQQLKKCWVNIKSKRKKELAHETRERLKTGGGPPPDNTTEFPELDLVVPHLSHNVGFLFDNDALQVNNSQLSTEAVSVVEANPEDLPQQHEADMTGNLDDSSEVPATTSCRNKQKFSPRPLPRKTVIETELKSRLNRLQWQMNYDEELHSLRKEEIKYTIDLAKEQLENERKAEERRIISFEREETRKQQAFEAEERRKEEIHRSKMSLLGKN